jgi:hypothetical protein
MDSSKTIAPLTVRYYLADSSHTDVDTVALLYKFPSNSAEIFATESILLHTDGFQDIARTDSFFYYHPFGPDGAFQFDLNTHQTRLLLDYLSGNHICANSRFVFFDIGGIGIHRFDLQTNSYSLVVPISSPYSLYGLDLFNGFLYAHLSLPSHSLKKYSLDGTLADSIQYVPSNSYYMTIYDSIVYSTENVQLSGTFQLNRFDLRTRTFRSNIMAPARVTEGIKIYDNRLYYVDYYKRYVGVVPIADLRSP